MEEKLRSIIRPIPWSSLLKGAAVGLLWFFTSITGPRSGGSFALFLAGAAIAYFVPLFRPRVLLAPFLGTLFLAAILPRQPASAILLAAAFFFMLGIKDLGFLNRETAYEILLSLLVFGGGWSLYHAIGSWISLLIAGGSFLVFAIFFFLLADVLPWRDSVSTNANADYPIEERRAWQSALAALLLFEAAMVLVFLPLDYLLQSVLLFITAVFLTQTLIRLRRGKDNPKRLRYMFGTFAVVMGIVLVLSGWGI